MSVRFWKLFHVCCSCAPLPGRKDRRQADARCPASHLVKGPRCGRAGRDCIKEEGDMAAPAAGRLGVGPGHPTPQLGGPLVALGAWRVGGRHPCLISLPSSTASIFKLPESYLGFRGCYFLMGLGVKGGSAGQRGVRARPSGQFSWRTTC